MSPRKRNVTPRKGAAKGKQSVGKVASCKKGNQFGGKVASGKQTISYYSIDFIYDAEKRIMMKHITDSHVTLLKNINE